MTRIRILTLDPGGHTGYALLLLPTDGRSPSLEVGHFPTSSRLDELILPSSIVVFEMPFHAPNTNPIVFEVKGAIMERGVSKNAKLVPQEASVPKFIWERYKLARMFKSGSSQHVKDAFCHLVYYYAHKEFLNPKIVIDMLGSAQYDMRGLI